MKYYFRVNALGALVAVVEPAVHHKSAQNLMLLDSYDAVGQTMLGFTCFPCRRESLVVGSKMLTPLGPGSKKARLADSYAAAAIAMPKDISLNDSLPADVFFNAIRRRAVGVPPNEIERWEACVRSVTDETKLFDSMEALYKKRGAYAVAPLLARSFRARISTAVSEVDINYPTNVNIDSVIRHGKVVNSSGGYDKTHLLAMALSFQQQVVDFGEDSAIAFFLLCKVFVRAFANSRVAASVQEDLQGMMQELIDAGAVAPSVSFIGKSKPVLPKV